MTHDAAHPDPHIEKRLQAIYSLHRKEMDFRLERSPYNDLLAALGNPQDHLPPTIHLAGTNGKGSTLAFLKSAYEAAGYSVHTYTSPHLVVFNERVVLNGQPISDGLLAHYLDLTAQANADTAVTFFEFTTAMAFRAMADHPADICLLETGLGGRLDCTNIISRPVATIITRIGEDHTDFLGDTIEKIAWEKSGIMKHNAPCIVAKQEHPVRLNPVFDNKAAEVGCDVLIEGRDWAMDDMHIGQLGLVGLHQRDNAATAAMVVRHLQHHLPVTDAHLNKGLAHAVWPARMEKITTGPIAANLPAPWELWFDCGHNPSGAEVIGTQIKQWKAENPARPVYFILGLGADKDAKGFMAPIAPHIDGLVCIDLPNARNPRSAADLMCDLGLSGDAMVAPTIAAAVKEITTHHNNYGIILASGSLYLYDQVTN